MKNGLRNGVLRWLAGGTGAVVTWKLLTLLEAQPQLFAGILERWGPLFGLGALAMLLVDRRVAQGVDAIREMAVAQQGLTIAVEQLVKRDDTHQIAVEAALGRVATLQQSSLERLDTLTSAMATHLESSVKHAGEYEHRLEEVEKTVEELRGRKNPPGN